HSPQNETVRAVPQLSKFVTDPQSLPRRAQNCASDSGGQVPLPQTLGPAAPQFSPISQVPQEAVRAVPQLSASVTLPQSLPSRAQHASSLSAVQVSQVPSTHEPSSPVPQETIGRVVPQRSIVCAAPQRRPRAAHSSASVSGTQLASAQRPERHS